MAVSKVSQREIVEVPYQLPDGSINAIMDKVILSMFDIELA